MTINISNNTPRVSYAVNQGATQTSFTVNFEFFDDADLNVYVDGAIKTLSTHYTVSGGAGSTGTVAISVTGASGGSTVVITRSIALERTTDFPASGAFQIASLNTELDRFTAIAADLNDELGRSLRLTDYDIAATLVLPALADRKGKVLAFNSSSGAVEAGPTITATQTVAAQAADIDTVAGISANVTTVAGIASNVTAVAAKSSLITSDFVSDLNALAVSDVISDINVLATSDIVSDLNTLGTSDFVSDLNALAAIASDITAAADVSSSIAASGTNATAAANSATAAANSATAAASSASSLTAGISANNILQADTGLADDDFLRIKGTKIEGRSAAELRADIGATTVGAAVFTAANVAAAQQAQDLEVGVDVQAFDADTVKKDVTNVFTKAQVPSTYTGSSLTLDFDAYQNFILTLSAGSNTLAAPSTEAGNVGQTGTIIFINPSSGAAATLSLHGDYESAGGAGLTISATNNAYDVVPYVIKADNSILLGAPQLAFS